jgi:hypothetical protein
MEHVVVTDVDWIRHTIRVFSFVIPAEVKFFPVEAKAREWITQDMTK